MVPRIFPKARIFPNVVRAEMLLRLVGHCVCLLRRLLPENRGGKGLGG
jgi:hypothetical protein